MKNYTYSFLVILLVSITATSCNKKDKDDINEEPLFDTNLFRFDGNPIEIEQFYMTINKMELNNEVYFSYILTFISTNGSIFGVDLYSKKWAFPIGNYNWVDGDFEADTLGFNGGTILLTQTEIDEFPTDQQFWYRTDKYYFVDGMLVYSEGWDNRFTFVFAGIVNPTSNYDPPYNKPVELYYAGYLDELEKGD